MEYGERLELVFARLSAIPVLRAIRRGLLQILPLVLTGSIVLMLLNLPVPAFQAAMDSLMGGHWEDISLSVHKGTFQVMSLAALIAVSHAMAGELPLFRSGRAAPLSAVLVSFGSLIAFDRSTDSIIELQAAASTGMFTAITVAVLATCLFALLHRLLPVRRQSYAYDSDTLLIASLRDFVPFLLTIFVFAIARTLMNVLGFSDAIGGMEAALGRWFLSGRNGVLTTLLYNLATHIPWFFGMHGTNLFEGVSREMFLAASEINIALAAGGAAPTQIITKEFFDVFVYMGGAGCTLGLILALMISGRRSNVHRVARLSLLPGLFNINETMIYGLPIIFNPYYLAPFLFAPMALSVTSYLAMWLGLVPLTVARVEWTTPLLLSGYASTGSVAGAVLQIVNLALSALIYLPFIRLYERHTLRGNKRAFARLSATLADSCAAGREAGVLLRNDELGGIARTLASELELCLRGERRALHLEYQPQVDAAGRVVGAEALLRWRHPVYGDIPPPVPLGLCDEAGLGDELGRWVMRTAFAQLGDWHRQGYERLRMSVNLSPRQLREDAGLEQGVCECVAASGVAAGRFELEITENEAVDGGRETRARLERIRAQGVALAIDDFGMGNSSLLYLRDLRAGVVKLDISLVHGVVDNTYSRQIVSSVLTLCKGLDVGVVAEGVETAEQFDALTALGCTIFQGFLFSRSLPPQAFLAYLTEHGEGLG